MNSELEKTAMSVAVRLKELADERQRVSEKGFVGLNSLDPALAALAKDVFQDQVHAARWLADEIRGLGWRTPWECLARGERAEVERVLYAIAYGDFS